MTLISLPSGLQVNLTNVTHIKRATWVVWPSATEPKTERTGLDVHFIGGSVLRLEAADAADLIAALAQ